MYSATNLCFGFYRCTDFTVGLYLNRSHRREGTYSFSFILFRLFLENIVEVYASFRDGKVSLNDFPAFISTEKGANPHTWI